MNKKERIKLIGEEAFLLEEKNKEFFKNCSTFKNKKVKGDEL